MTTRKRPASARLTSFDDPLPTREERAAAGRELRKITPRTSHGGWQPAAGRFDPVQMLVESNKTRVESLVPLRFARMAASPFTFFRGSALVMAHDLATTPAAGINLQLCGDAHIANFGIFASPERRLVFDLNDFDETYPGPFEWDLKRLAASIVLAARERGLDQADCRKEVLVAVAAYQEWMARLGQMNMLDVWYAKLEVTELLEANAPSMRRVAEKRLTKLASKTNLKALDKLTEVVDGRHRIVEDPPLIERFDQPELRERLEAVLTDYRMSLAADRRSLFDRFRFVDFARKVVGVGSVGTRCWIALFQGPNGGPLFLQIKEARPSAIQLALKTDSKLHEGQRVVEGQRTLQAASDILLGWGTDPGSKIDYFLRQLWDSKGSIDLAGLSPAGFSLYASFCGRALARAHARTGDANSINGYLGNSTTFGQAIADFARDYADQSERDHAALVAAIAGGDVPVAQLA